MSTEGKVNQLQHTRDALKWQADELNKQMSETKAQRQALEKEVREAQLHLNVVNAHEDVEEIQRATATLAELESQLATLEASLQSMNQRMTAVQREHIATSAEINRAEVEAANVANRIKSLRYDLIRVKRQAAGSPHAATAIGSITADLQVSESKYTALTGTSLPPEAA